MFQKDMHIAYLLDFYGDVLQDKTKRVLVSYYDEDLSLAEIAAIEGISRQGVRHIIKSGEEQLHFLEERLGLAAHHSSLRENAAQLEKLSELALEQPIEYLRPLCETAVLCAKLMRNS